MTVRELRKYCEENHLSYITYNSKNQKWYRAGDPVIIDLRFQKILVSECLDIACLRDEKKVLQFNVVNAAKIDTDRSMLETSITFFATVVFQMSRRLHTLYLQTD